MDEKDLIQKIQTLKHIKPSENWAVLTKERILSKRFEQKETLGLKGYVEFFRFVFGHKYATSSLIALVVVAGLFAFAKNSAPGDPLYSLKKTVEQTQLSLMSEEAKTGFVLSRANDKLENLVKIAQAKQTQKIAPAMSEYKASVTEVAKKLSIAENQDSIKEIAMEVKRLNTKENEIKSLGIEIEDNAELDSALIQTIMKEVASLENKPLSDGQKETLKHVVEEAQTGRYASALEMILSINNN